MRRYEQMVIGIDQSYTRCGMSIAADDRIIKVGSVDLTDTDDKTYKRKIVRDKVLSLCQRAQDRSFAPPIVVVERIRQFSKNFLSVPYIKGTGALIATIVDAAWACGVETYSINTKSWKSGILGTSKPADNDFGVPGEKWPCVEYMISQGFEDLIKRRVEGRRRVGTFVDSDGIKWEYDHDAADSAGLALSWFRCPSDRFEREL